MTFDRAKDSPPPENGTEMRDALIKRLGLWLAIGNGGGLIALAGKFPDLKESIAAAVLPSLWLFSVGLVAAFLMNLSLLADFGRQADAAAGKYPYSPHKIWDPVGGWSAAVASIAFLVGIFLPLTAISLSDFRFGLT